VTETSTTENGVALTPKERNELVRIVKGRFKLLRFAARSRAQELIENEMAAEPLASDAKAREFEKRSRPLLKKVAELRERLAEIEAEAAREGYRPTWKSDVDVVFRPRRRFDWDDVRAVERHVVAEIDRAELAVIEELLLGGLETSAAREFLAQIPSVETLVEKGLSALSDEKQLALTQA
jgi:hypothetical protein